MFVIDPKKVIRLTLSYPAASGRNFDEIIRSVLSFSHLRDVIITLRIIFSVVDCMFKLTSYKYCWITELHFLQLFSSLTGIR